MKHALLVRATAVAALGLAGAGCANATTRSVGGGIALAGAGTTCVGVAMVTQGAICGGEQDADRDGREEPSLFAEADPEAGAIVVAIGAGIAVLGGMIFAIGATDPPTGIASTGPRNSRGPLVLALPVPSSYRGARSSGLSASGIKLDGSESVPAGVSPRQKPSRPLARPHPSAAVPSSSGKSSARWTSAGRRGSSPL